MQSSEALPYALTIARYYNILHGRLIPFTIADWITVQAWHQLGIPVQCVLKGMDRAYWGKSEALSSLESCDLAVKEVCRETCSVLTHLS